ncbi:hypothetical protein [Acetobacter sp. DsW_063]|uniref:hypothetical protein n=1 Tax=Acetobacter sp. DsW_063 TaxID=1514894 RepID=UPI000A3B4D68|nr:hypothetical protein [Acetobacter sp. DsW_063]OUJ15418.1 hypothetical protein HK28_07795 [Acetobacter sp. DsW_063]
MPDAPDVNARHAARRSALLIAALIATALDAFAAWAVLTPAPTAEYRVLFPNAAAQCGRYAQSAPLAVR